MEAILKTSVEKIETTLEMLGLAPSEWRKQHALKAAVGHTGFSEGRKMLLIALGQNENMESIKGERPSRDIEKLMTIEQSEIALLSIGSRLSTVKLCDSADGLFRPRLQFSTVDDLFELESTLLPTPMGPVQHCEPAHRMDQCYSSEQMDLICEQTARSLFDMIGHIKKDIQDAFLNLHYSTNAMSRDCTLLEEIKHLRSDMFPFRSAFSVNLDSLRVVQEIAKTIDVVDTDEGRTIDMLFTMTAFDKTCQIMEDHFCRSMKFQKPALVDIKVRPDRDPYEWYEASPDLEKQICQVLPDFCDLNRAEPILHLFFKLMLLNSNLFENRRKARAQYCTPTEVIRFMWDAALQQQSIVISDEEKVQFRTMLDPSCGSGTFLVEYIVRALKELENSFVWHNAHDLRLALVSLVDAIWACDIDRFAVLFARHNVYFHLLPALKTLAQLSGNSVSTFVLPPLNIVCCNAVAPRASTAASATEQSQIAQLRSRTNFDFAITNPPYANRTRITSSQFDPVMFQSVPIPVVQQSSSQLYLTFLLLGISKLKEKTGSLVYITPSAWLTLTPSGDACRSFLWSQTTLRWFFYLPHDCVFAEKTDSLLTVLQRHRPSPTNVLHTCVLRQKTLKPHTHLEAFKVFLTEVAQSTSMQSGKPCLQRSTSLLYINEFSQEDSTVPSGEPWSKFLKRASCSLSQYSDFQPLVASGNSDPAPLIWIGGQIVTPNTFFVVRTRWAHKRFGKKSCDEYIHPCVFFNRSKCQLAKDQEKLQFWQRMGDPQRLEKFEVTNVGSFCLLDMDDGDERLIAKYSMLGVPRKDVILCHERFRGEHQMLYEFLKEVYVLLPPKNQCRKGKGEISYSKALKKNSAQKILGTINCGHSTLTKPRLQFALDRDCLQFTQKHFALCRNVNFAHHQRYSIIYWLGILNSSWLNYILMDTGQQGGRPADVQLKSDVFSKIPFIPLENTDLVSWMELLTRILCHVSKSLYRHSHTSKKEKLFLQCVRRSFVSESEKDILCLDENVHELFQILHISRFAADQFVFSLYAVPHEKQKNVEQELNLFVPESIDRFPVNEIGEPVVIEWADEHLNYCRQKYAPFIEDI